MVKETDIDKRKKSKDIEFILKKHTHTHTHNIISFKGGPTTQNCIGCIRGPKKGLEALGNGCFKFWSLWT